MNQLVVRVKYQALPMYEDGVTTRSTYLLDIYSLISRISLNMILGAMVKHGIVYEVNIRTEHVEVHAKYADQLWGMIADQGWELHNTSTPMFVFDLLKRFEMKRKVVDSMEEIRDKITPMIFDCMRPYQQTLVKIGVERNDVFIADEMGTGKTFTALGIARYWNDKTLIITLPNIMYNWYDEILNRMDWDRKSVMICQSTKKVIKSDWGDEGVKVIIIPYGILSNKEVRSKCKEWANTLVLDECHSVKNLTAKRTRAVLDISPSMLHRIILSGSPFEKSCEIYSQMKVLDPLGTPPFFHYDTKKTIVSREDFASRYCDPKRVMFKGGFPQWEFKGNVHQEELKVVVSQFMVRRLKKDVCTQLPMKVRHRHDLPEVEGMFVEEILKEMYSGRVIDRSKYTEAITMTCEHKLPHVITHVKEVLSNQLEHGKIVLFFHHMKMKEALMDICEELGLEYIIIDGSVGAEQRHALQGRFQKEESCRVALLSIKASGTGTNFTAASNVIMTEILPTAADMFQAEDRCHRMGQTSVVNVTYLVLPKSVDEVHVQLIVKKFVRSSAVMDQEKQGVDMTRKRKIQVISE
jgi:SWI/SNF-related matrix-associated actin-dependent regulator 1 of chromatin subfamily A